MPPVMPAETMLSYSTARPPRWRAVAFFAAAVLAVSGLTAATTLVGVVESSARIDTVTGTIVRDTTYVGLFRRQRVDRSLFENVLVARGIAWVPQWQFLGYTEYACVGTVVDRGCGSGSLSGSFAKSYLGDWASGKGDDDLTRLVAVLQTGTDSQKEEAIYSIFESN